MLTLFHNPRCSKSREALTLLEQQSIPFQVVDYIKQPLSETQLSHLLKALGMNARQLLRTKESAYTELNLANTALTEAELIAAMISQPSLMERPILLRGDNAAIGRPLANLQALLQ
ncbi:arsenate reductase (glutaredoxin) [Arsukibacterium sp.]|uniref:arsenate reductase (glutaredoxin) n=1 Tax=Arsukibacterium sp. TaxID=1977258 RepID=UPI002FD93039